MSDTHHFATALPRALPTGESRDLILYSRFGKRVLDICIAILLLPVLVPLIGLLIGLVKLDGGLDCFDTDGSGAMESRLTASRSAPWV